jgi:hypothetical protein
MVMKMNPNKLCVYGQAREEISTRWTVNCKDLPYVTIAANNVNGINMFNGPCLSPKMPAATRPRMEAALIIETR